MTKTIKSLSLITLALLLFFIPSCNSDSPVEIINATPITEDGEYSTKTTQNLSDFDLGQMVKIKMGSNTSISLINVTTNADSLFVLENTGKVISKSKGLKSSGNNSISKVDNTKGIYNVIPQSNGTISFTGRDIGVTADNTEVILTKIKVLEPAGKNYFDYKIEPTEFDYRERGIDEHLWPTYQYCLKIDLNSNKWSSLRDKDVVIMQYALQTGPTQGGYGGNYSDKFGIIEEGNIIYDNEIEGVFRLSGKNKIMLYTFMRASKYAGDASHFRIYILVPEVLSSTPLEIIGFPHVFQIPCIDENQTYDITFDNIPSSVFNMLISGFIQGRPRYIGELNNGKPIESVVYLKELKKGSENGTFSAIFTVKGENEPFIINDYYRSYTEVNDFGDISFAQSSSPSWINNTITSEVPEQIETLTSEKMSITIPYSFAQGKTYKITVSSENQRLNLYECTSRGAGQKSLSSANNYSQTYTVEGSGYITVYNTAGTGNIHWSVASE